MEAPMLGAAQPLAGVSRPASPDRADAAGKSRPAFANAPRGRS